MNTSPTWKLRLKRNKQK